MANRKYSDRTPDGTSNPLKAEDLIGVSNEDGAGGFDLSKKITIDELKTFLESVLSSIGGAGTTGTIPLFTPDGSTLGDSHLTSTSDGITNLLKNSSIRVAPDPTTMLYVVGGTASTDEYPGWFETTWNASAAFALNAVAEGNGSENNGLDADARNADRNVAVRGRAHGNTTTLINAEALTNIGGSFGAGADGSEKSSCIVAEGDVNSSGDIFGMIVHTANAGAGDSYGLKLKDGSEGIGKVLQCITADGVAQWTEPSGGGWLGSETRIKIAPWDIVSYNDKDGVSIQNNGGVVNDAAAKITTMVTGVFIPTGYRATAFMINASANIAVELFESQIDDDTQVSKGSGNANTEVNITNVDSTTTNYLSIIIVEAGNDIYGGYITIQKI